MYKVVKHNKVCKHCKKKKPVKEFRKVGFYFKCYCAICENELNKKHYKKNAKRIKDNSWF